MSDNTAFEQRSLIHRRETVGFVTYLGLGAGQYELVRFQRPVIWLRDEESTWSASLDGTVMKEGATFNDFYGPGTSSSEIVEAAAEWHARFPAMRVEAATRLRLFPAIQAREKPFYGRAVKYHPLPNEWFGDDIPFAEWHKSGRKAWWREAGVTRLDEVVTTITIWRDGEVTEEGRALAVRLTAEREAMRAGQVEASAS